MEKKNERQKSKSAAKTENSAERVSSAESQNNKTSENPLITGRLLITGDTHGDHGAMAYIAKLLREGDCLFVAGDFGYIFLNDTSEKSYLRDVNHFLVKHNCYLVFVDGNHENHPALNSYPVTTWNGARCHKIWHRIIHVCRGEILKIYKSEEQTEPIRIWCFGGAFSIDRQYRKLNEGYWEEELPTDEDYVNSSKNLEAEGYQIDCGITHTCPLYRVRTLGCYHAAREEEPLQNYFQWVCDKLNQTNEASADGSDDKKGRGKRFKRWYFGHWHTDWNKNWLELMHLEEFPQKCRAIYLDVEDMETGEVID